MNSICRVALTFAVLLVSSVFVFGQNCPPTPIPFTDNFDSPTLDSCWNWVREDSNHWSLIERPGWLWLETQAFGDYGNDCCQRNKLVRVFVDSPCRILTRLSFQPYANYHAANLLIFYDENNYIRVGRSYEDGQRAFFQIEIGGQVQTQLIDNADTLEWLRLDIQRGFAVGYISTDSMYWEYIGSTQVLWDLQDLRFGLSSTQGTTPGPSAIAAFDYFRIDPLTSVGFATAIITGPPYWEYELHWLSGCLDRLTFKPVCAGTNGWTTGEAAAAGWNAAVFSDSVVFSTATPLTSGSLSGFILSHPSCSHPLTWTAGDSSGFIDGPLPVELASFDALSTEEGIRVTFATASEMDNDYFEILRGNSENGAFSRIATLPSQGNSATGHRYTYLDRAVTSGQTYWYYLADVDLNGNRTEHRDLMQSATMSGAAELPSDYARSAYPNPFNPTTTISFALPEAGVVKIAVFDVAGRWIQTLVNEKRIAGNHTITFDSRDLPSGVYFARMESGSFARAEKMMLVR